jgi:hypothetical protein
MLEENTKCWICNRTEEEIIAEIKRRGWSEGIFEEIRKVNTEEGKSAECTKRGIISFEDVGQLGYSYPLCGICNGLVYSLADESAIDRLEYEKNEGFLLTGDPVFKTVVED